MGFCRNQKKREKRKDKGILERVKGAWQSLKEVKNWLKQRGSSRVEEDERRRRQEQIEKFKKQFSEHYKKYKEEWFQYILSMEYVFRYGISSEDRKKIVGNSERDYPPERKGSLLDMDISFSDREVASEALLEFVIEELKDVSEDSLRGIRDIELISFLNDYFKDVAQIDALDKVKQYVPDSGRYKWERDRNKLSKKKKERIKRIAS